MYQIKIEESGKDHCFALYEDDNDKPIVRSMRLNLSSTAKVIRILTTMVRRHVNAQLLDAMAERKIDHWKLNAYAEKMTRAVCVFMTTTPEFKMMHTHPMFLNALKKYEGAKYFNQLLVASFAYSNDNRSTAYRDERVQDSVGRDFTIRMGLQNVDDRLVRVSAKLFIRQTGKYRIVLDSTQPDVAANIEFTRMTLPNDTLAYHDLLGAVHSLPLHEIATIAESIQAKKVW